MTKRRNTAPKAPLSPVLAEELDSIQEEMLKLVHHLRLADQRLWGDLEGVPDELQAAAVVLHDATEAFNALHNRLDVFNVRLADLRHGLGWRERMRTEMHLAVPAEETRQ